MESDDDKSVDILLDGVVGDCSMRSADFGRVLQSIKSKKRINLLINSPGGLITEGTAMYSMIRARGNVHTVVIGMAASMASVIHQAGSRRSMMPGTCLMIHNPSAEAPGRGEAGDHEHAIETLNIVKKNLVDLYHRSTGQPKKTISDMMDATTILDPEEAKKLGFADEVLQDAPAAWNHMPSLQAKADFYANVKAQVAASPGRIYPRSGRTDEQQIEFLRERMHTTTDDAERVAIARQLRQMRGHAGILP